MSTLATTNLKNASSGSNNIVLNTDGTTTIAAPSNIIKSGTAVASTSGVAIDFTGLPSWVKRVTVMFDGVSTNGTSAVLIQLGDSGGIETTGYASQANTTSSGGTNAITLNTAGIVTGGGGEVAASVRSGVFTLSNVSGNIWVGAGLLTGNNLCFGAGSKTLSGTLDRLRITTVNGTDTFDAGSVNILWEG